ncbi:MAG: hypothetical protein ABR552_01795 [Actinomycetota bacterium]|nr:hypothetical protein [Actinomycetota bacterium]
MRRIGPVAALVLLALVVRAPTAWGCTCVQRTLADQFRAATVVFVGSVAATDTPQGRAENVTFSVDAVYKGDTTENVTVHTPRSQADCGVLFVPGQRWTVFTSGAGTSATTDACRGTTTDVNAPSKAGHPAPLRTFDHPANATSPPVAAARVSSSDQGARAGALGAAALLVVLLLVALVVRARRRRIVSDPE